MRRSLPAVVPYAALHTRARPRGPLWPGARYTHEDRACALQRGLRFIYRLARAPENFEAYGDDFLWCFYSLSVSTADPWIKREAWRMGQERARQWRRDYRRLPRNADAFEVCGWIFGNLAADCLKVHDERLTRDLIGAAAKFKPADYLRFDPVKERIPRDVPEDCAVCDTANRRGRKRCRKCGAALKILSRYEVLTDALITAHAGELSGIQMGRSLADVAARLVALRPYRGPRGGSHRGYLDLVYTVTHVVYALNNYGLYRLRPSWLPHEFAFLKKHLRQSIADGDPETTGEFLDTLKAFGLTEADPVIRAGMDFVLSRQHFDGSWGEPGEDCYTPYHATWTAIGGLMDYAFRGERSPHPEALRRAR
jgi:hypothetical protein